MKESKTVAIKIVGVTKRYSIRMDKPTLIETLVRGSKGQKFLALQNISLEVYKGERLGIVGRNGSGKTTLLKIISGITTPNAGKVRVMGRVISLIDLSAGFHPELSGMENLKLNGLLIGMDKNELRKKYDEIVEYSGIGKFINAPFYTYSSGMKLRLGFSVAVAANPDILILDEGILVGDEEFQRKCEAKIQEFKNSDKTIIIVSHWIEDLRRKCERIIWLERGKIKKDGDLRVLDEYQKF